MKQLRELSSVNNTSDKKELIRLQKYTLHLERQIKDSLNTCNNESLTQLTTLNTEVERLHHLQTELDMVCNCTCVYNTTYMYIRYIHTCTCIYNYTYIHTYIHTYIQTYIHTCTCTCTYMYIHTCSLLDSTKAIS